MLIKIGYRNLLRNKRRTANILLTIALGTASLLLFQGFNASIMDMYRDGTIRSRWGHGQLTTKGYRQQIYAKPWEHWINNPQAMTAALRTIPGVKYVFPRIEFFSLISNGSINISGRGQGVDAGQENQFFNSMNFVSGHNLDQEVDGIVLGKGLAAALNVKVGDRLTLLANTVQGSFNGIDTTVVGIFHTGLKDFDDVFFRVPLSIAQKLLDVQSVESISLGLRSHTDWDLVAAQVHEKLPEVDAVPFNILDEVYYQHSVDWLKSQFGIFQFIIIGVVILGIFNTVSTSVLERKHEIGNLRANGESARDVVSLLFCEGVFMGLAGGLAGLLMGYFVALVVLRNGIVMPPAPGITRVFAIHLRIEPSMATATLAMGLAASLGATMLAAFGIARKPIADLLRSI